MCKISVIVPVYNAESYLPRCIESIIDQTHEDLEILLVDDGSTDSSGDICDEYAQKDKRIKVIHKKNGGQSSARNAALDVFMGDYLIFVDNDDAIYDPRTLEEMLWFSIKHQADLVIADEMSPQGDAHLALLEPVFSGISALTLSMKIGIYTGTVWSKLYSASVFKEHNVRFTLDLINEDEELIPRIFYYSKRVGFLNRKSYARTIHEASQTQRNDPYTTFRKARDRIIVADQILSFFEKKDIPTQLKRDIRTRCLGFYFAAVYSYTYKIEEPSLKNQLYEILENKKSLLRYSLGTHKANYIGFYILTKCVGLKRTIQLIYGCSL